MLFLLHTEKEMKSAHRNASWWWWALKGRDFSSEIVGHLLFNLKPNFIKTSHFENSFKSPWLKSLFFNDQIVY